MLLWRFVHVSWKRSCFTDGQGIPRGLKWPNDNSAEHWCGECYRCCASYESLCHSALCIVSSVIGIYREQCYDPSFWHRPSLCYVLSVRTRAHTWGGTSRGNLGQASFWDILEKLLNGNSWRKSYFLNYFNLCKKISVCSIRAIRQPLPFYHLLLFSPSPIFLFLTILLFFFLLTLLLFISFYLSHHSSIFLF